MCVCEKCLTGVRLRPADFPLRMRAHLQLTFFHLTSVFTSVRRMCGRGARGATQWVAGGGQVQSHWPHRRDRRQRRWPLKSYCWQNDGSGERQPTTTSRALPDRSAASDWPGAPVQAWDSHQGAGRPHLGRQCRHRCCCRCL